MMGPAADTITSHYHYTRVVGLAILASFLMGHFIHVWLQVNSIARARLEDEIDAWFVAEQNAPRLVYRFFISLMIFIYVWNYPATLPAIIGYSGFTLSENTVALLTLPMSIPVAAMWGVFSDTLLAYAPILKNALPPIEFTTKEKTITTITATEVKTTSSAATVPGDK